MRYDDIVTLIDLERGSRRRQQAAIRDRSRRDLAALAREIAALDQMVRRIRHERLAETIRKPVKPLTPEQTAKRAERDRKRAEAVRDIQGSASKRIADLKAQIGQ